MRFVNVDIHIGKTAGTSQFHVKDAPLPLVSSYRDLGATITNDLSHSIYINELDGCIVWNAHNTVLGLEALLIYIVPVCYVKTGRYVISLLVYTGKKFQLIRIFH